MNTLQFSQSHVFIRSFSGAWLISKESRLYCTKKLCACETWLLDQVSLEVSCVWLRLEHVGRLQGFCVTEIDVIFYNYVGNVYCIVCCGNRYQEWYIICRKMGMFVTEHSNCLIHLEMASMTELEFVPCCTLRRIFILQILSILCLPLL